MQVSIIGCGWLGLPLAKSLIQKGHDVIGSTTSADKLKRLKDAGITPVQLKLEPMPVGEDFNLLFESELVIINIPPGRKKNPPHFYAEQIKYLKYQLQNSKVKKVIFISSTSFYPNTNSTVDLSTNYDFANGSSKAVVKGEEQISAISQELIILRCGGLMGDDRIPGKWFVGKETQGADTPVNYVHRDDVIATIEGLIEGWPQAQKVFNLVSDDHPTRKEVHEKMAEKYGFELPKWVEPSTIQSKVVESSFKESGLKSPLNF